MAFFTDRFIVFLCPHPNYFQLSPRMLFASWDGIIILISAITLLGFSYYYFVTKPNYTAFKRFWIMNSIILVVSIVFALATILNKSPSMLKQGAELDNWRLSLATIAAATETTVVIILAVYLIFMILAYIPGLNSIKWQLRAMRRYPISFKA